MTRSLLALAVLSAAVLGTGPSPAGEKAPGDDKAPAGVQITWHGQSFFQIKSTKGTRIVIDPHLIQEYPRVLNCKADIILMTHLHDDHTQLEAVENHKDKDVKVHNGLKGTVQKNTWNPIDEKIKDVH